MNKATVCVTFACVPLHCPCGTGGSKERLWRGGKGERGRGDNADMELMLLAVLWATKFSWATGVSCLLPASMKLCKLTCKFAIRAKLSDPLWQVLAGHLWILLLETGSICHHDAEPTLREVQLSKLARIFFPGPVLTQVLYALILWAHLEGGLLKCAPFTHPPLAVASLKTSSNSASSRHTPSPGPKIQGLKYFSCSSSQNKFWGLMFFSN